MNAQTIGSALLASGWSQDRWGHFKKERQFKNLETGNVVTRLCRVQLRPRVVKFQIRAELPLGNEWHTLSSAYYSKVSKDHAGNLRLGIHVLNR